MTYAVPPRNAGDDDFGSPVSLTSVSVAFEELPRNAGDDDSLAGLCCPSRLQVFEELPRNAGDDDQAGAWPWSWLPCEMTSKNCPATQGMMTP